MWNKVNIFVCLHILLIITHVESEDNVKPPYELSGISHNLFASSVQIENSQRILIKNLTYDGFGPDVRFWLGKGETPSLENGILLLDETGSSKKLHSYRNSDIVLEVPEGIDVNEFDFFGLWCVVDQELIGFVPFNGPAVINRSLIDVGSIPVEESQTVKVLKGFKNKVISDDILILNNNTVVIKNLTFFSPPNSSPFQFRLGRGQNLTVQVEYKSQNTDMFFNNEDVALILSNGIEIGYFDTLGIWSQETGFFEKITIQNNLTYLELEPMSQLAHGLKTGPVYLLNDKTFLIKDIHYDGLGPDAYFWVGNGSQGPNSQGRPIPDENGSTDILRRYRGKDIILKLPEDLTAANIDYIGLWCIKFSSNFGFTSIRKDWNLNRNMMFQSMDYIQLDPISSLAHGVKSGPVFILNETTLFVNNLFYDGRGPDAHFWVGNGSNGPDSNGVSVADETGSMGILKEYIGQDVMVHLPPGITVRNIEYFGLWCIQYSHNFGFTTIPKDMDSKQVPVQPVHNGIEIVNMVQKCCLDGQVKTPTGCMTKNVSYVPVEIYEGNHTIFNDEPLKNLIKIPYYFQPQCSHGMYSLEQDEFFLLSSGQLLLPYEGQMSTKDTYCMDIYKFPDGEWKMSAFLCFPNSQPPAFLTYIKAACIYISAFFLILTTIIFLFVKSARDLRGYTVIGFSMSMAISFIFLSTAQIISVDDEGCTAIAYIYQFFVVLNFTMLSLLNFETFYIVLKFENPQHHLRLYIYGGIAAIMPFLMLLVSHSIDKKVPTKFSNPSGGNDSCWMRSDKKVVFYYVPIIFSILLSIVFSILTLWKIKVNDKNNHVFWNRIKDDVKNVYRSCYIVLILMAVCWTAEVNSYFFETNDGFWIAIDILECLQGFFVFLVFVMHNPVIGILKAKWNEHFGKRVDADMELRRPNIHEEENAPFM